MTKVKQYNFGDVTVMTKSNRQIIDEFSTHINSKVYHTAKRGCSVIFR